MELLRNSKVCLYYHMVPLRRILKSRVHLQDKKARKLTKKRVCCKQSWCHKLANKYLIAIVCIQLGTLLRSKRKLEELGTIIQESRRAH